MRRKIQMTRQVGYVCPLPMQVGDNKLGWIYLKHSVLLTWIQMKYYDILKKNKHPKFIEGFSTCTIMFVSSNWFFKQQFSSEKVRMV